MLDTKGLEPEAPPRRQGRGRPTKDADKLRGHSIVLRVSTRELDVLTGLAATVNMRLGTFVRTVALNVEIKTPLPEGAFDCASALTQIGRTLSRAVSEAEAGRPITIDPDVLQELRTIVEKAGFAALGLRVVAP